MNDSCQHTCISFHAIVIHATVTTEQFYTLQQRLQRDIHSLEMRRTVPFSYHHACFQQSFSNQTRNIAITTDCTSIFQNLLFAHHVRHIDDSLVSSVPSEGFLCCASTVQLHQTRPLLQQVPLRPRSTAPGSKGADSTCSISKTMSPVQDHVAHCIHE